MMAIVSMGDDRLPPRVGPKVFEDLPTADELKSLRKSRNLFVIASLLLAGMAIAALVVAVIFSQSPGKLAAVELQLTTEKNERKAEVDALHGDVRQGEAALDAFLTLQNKRGQISELRAKIDKAIQDKGPAALTYATKRNGAYPSVDEKWPLVRQAAEKGLDDEVARLTKFESDVRAYHGPVVCADPLKCP